MDKKILVVDDAMFMRSIIRKILKEDGYTQVWEAQDGEKAMELFREVSPDLVLLDITMNWNRFCGFSLTPGQNW